MKILIIDTYYPKFIEEIYSSNPKLDSLSYDDQLEIFYSEFFGTSDFYSRNLNKSGHQAREIIYNAGPLQNRWGIENSVYPPIEKISFRLKVLYNRKHMYYLTQRNADLILQKQISSFKPDLIHFQDPRILSRAIQDFAKSSGIILTSQIASPFDEKNEDFSGFDLILSSFPHFVEKFNSKGIRSVYFQLGFEHTLLDVIPCEDKSRDAIFIGGISRAHQERIDFLEELASLTDFEWWGYGHEILAPESKLKSKWRGPAWGKKMFQLLGEAKISINHHIDASQNYANNMRLYESTGMKSLLLTDYKDNISNIFTKDEVVTYTTAEECAQRIRYFLDNPIERKTIAENGQAKTLTQHTYAIRMKEFTKLVENAFPKIKNQA